MPRLVTAELDLEIAASAELVFQIATAAEVPLADEAPSFRQGDRELFATELVDAAGNRLHRLSGDRGPLEVRYRATAGDTVPAAVVTELDAITFLRPSRYCPSDELFSRARGRFGGLSGRALVDAVVDFVADSLTYTLGSSLGTDDAVATLQSGQGVCRDYAHVVIALLRAMDVAARYVACYAPGLEPMDFHAVVEAWVEGAWRVIDATTLAPRSSLLRIATGRDAADTAFLTVLSGRADLVDLRVGAVADQLPDDDLDELVSLG